MTFGWKSGTMLPGKGVRIDHHSPPELVPRWPPRWYNVIVVMWRVAAGRWEMRWAGGKEGRGGFPVLTCRRHGRRRALWRAVAAAAVLPCAWASAADETSTWFGGTG